MNHSVIKYDLLKLSAINKIHERLPKKTLNQTNVYSYQLLLLQTHPNLEDRNLIFMKGSKIMFVIYTSPCLSK
jgi:hypothetical protein